MASSGRLARDLSGCTHLQPAQASIEKLTYGRRRLRGPAVTFHADRPSLRFRAGGFPNASLATLRAISARIFAPMIVPPQITSRDLMVKVIRSSLKADDGRWEGEGIKNGQKLDYHADRKTGVITSENLDD
nr:PepSY domain-containing protein [Bradyrhizobium sp. AUGA SZCCT0283]